MSEPDIVLHMINIIYAALPMLAEINRKYNDGPTDWDMQIETSTGQN